MSEPITPVEIAASFLEKWAMMQAGQMPSGPVFDRVQTQAILLSIRVNPYSMVSFFSQVGWIIKNNLDIAHGENSKQTVEALLEWGAVSYGFLMPLFSGMMEANAEMLDKHYPELLYGTDSPDNVPLPEGDPSDIYKGLDMDLGFVTPPTPDEPSE
jgi:hypothetical protein